MLLVFFNPFGEVEIAASAPANASTVVDVEKEGGGVGVSIEAVGLLPWKLRTAQPPRATEAVMTVPAKKTLSTKKKSIIVRTTAKMAKANEATWDFLNLIPDNILVNLP